MHPSSAAIVTAATASPTLALPPNALHPLEDEDLLLMVLQQVGIDFNHDAHVAAPERARLRLLHSTARRLIDERCLEYRDCRRSGAAVLRIDPGEVAQRAVAAVRILGKPSIRRLRLEGLDDEALVTVAAAVAAHAPRLEVLWLQRGLFSGSGLFTCHGALPPEHQLVGDGMDAAHPVISSAESSSPAAPSPHPPIFQCPSPVAPPSRLFPRLLEMDLGGCGQLTDAGLEALVSAAPLLASLRVTVNALLRRPRLTCPWLRSATLAICANLCDGAVDALVLGSPLLRELNLWRCSSLHRPAIRAPYLEKLNLCECVEMEDGALHHVGAGCPKLSSLLLAGCDALAGGARYGGGPSLTALDVSDMASTCDALLTAACESSPSLKRLDFSRSGPAVQAPNVGGSHLTALIATRCESLVDEAVSGACDTSPALQTLMLALCAALHSPRIHGEQVCEINLSGCFALRDSAVAYACAHCPRLTRLSLSLCAALVEPVICGASLRKVELSHGEKLSRPFVEGASLEELSLSGCAKLEDSAVEGACGRCPKLRRLSISGCSKLRHCRVESASLRVLICKGVAPELSEAAGDRLRCPALSKLVSDKVDAMDDDAHGLVEVD
jgi:hypothetical protein